jgi:hypothetical protein
MRPKGASPMTLIYVVLGVAIFALLYLLTEAVDRV